MIPMRTRKEIRPIAANDSAFFQEFYQDYKNFMFYIARKYAPSQADCEDIVQEAIIRLLNNISTLKKLNHSKTAKYIILTIRAAFLDIERRKHGDKAIFLNDETLETLIKADLLITDSMPDLSARLEVERLKKELPARDWLVLEGKYCLGYTQEELGQMIGVAPDSIRMILCRAKEKARKILQQDLKGGDENE